MHPCRFSASQDGRYRSQCLISVLLVLSSVINSAANAIERLELEVRETGGLARRGYPTQALLKLPRPVAASTKFRLLSDGKPVVAQFRPDGDKETGKWWLDFQTEMEPNEERRYVVEFGDDVLAGPERLGGHKLSKVDKGFAIANAPYITWSVPHDLKGLLQSVDFAPSEFLRAESPGLLLRDRQSREYPFSGTGRVIRQGPMAVALRFQKAESQKQLRDVRSTVDLTFPAPVSWVELEWNLDDPLNNVAAVGLQLDLNVERTKTPATLVDFGATSVVYTSLQPGQAAELLAGPAASGGDADGSPLWKVLRGDQDRLTSFALGPKRSSAGRIEGWTHVMDQKICLALAMEGFARDTRDRIIAAGDGRVTVWREYDGAVKAGQKRLRLWLHFVHFPPQASAGASPQQMQSPLEVRQLDP
jgi:hypothetical protein